MSGEDQASRLRKMMRETRTTRTIAVTSGKGGVGKSNVSLNLAILLSAGGSRVALVDADLGLANLDILCNVSPRANLSHVIAGTRKLDEIVVDLPCGVQLVPGASGLSRLAHLSDFQRAQLLESLGGLENDNDFIIVDCAAGIGPDVLAFAGAADLVTVVTTPEPTAVADGYATIKSLVQRKYAGRICSLVNQALDRDEARQTYQRISTVARQFLATTVVDAGYVVADAKLREAVRRREPLVLAYPRSPAADCLTALARKLRSGDVPLTGRQGFFKRVANWFAG